MRVRAILLGLAVLGAFGVVLLRAAKVQLLDRSRLSRLQRDQTRRELEWAPRRGLVEGLDAGSQGAIQDLGKRQVFVARLHLQRLEQLVVDVDGGPHRVIIASTCLMLVHHSGPRSAPGRSDDAGVAADGNSRP